MMLLLLSCLSCLSSVAIFFSFCWFALSFLSSLFFLSSFLLLLAPVSSVLLPCCHLPLLCLSALLWVFSALLSLLCAALLILKRWGQWAIGQSPQRYLYQFLKTNIIKTSQFDHSLIIDSTIVVDRGIQIAHNLTVALVCCCVLLVLLCVHWQVGSSEPGRIMRRQRKARSFAFAFVALLLLPRNQTGKRAEAK
jgi:hypothetical protein